tara:strand:+ start:1529 stop:1669 length:141 start_codon:yes stop_codon:yes gene_type:complete
MQFTIKECEEKIQELTFQIQRLIGYKQALSEMEQDKFKDEEYVPEE